jgi:hypothetical protein
MKRRTVLAALGGAAFVRPIAADAQPAAGVPRIGLLVGSSPSDEATTLDAFRGVLEKLGYIDGQTILIGVRYAMGQPDRFASLARELVVLAPPVIACVGRRETTALQAATHTTPIVFCRSTIQSNKALSLRWPGRGATHRVYPNVGRARSETVAIAPRDRAVAVACGVFGQPKSDAGSPATIHRCRGGREELGHRLAARRRRHLGRSDCRVRGD